MGPRRKPHASPGGKPLSAKYEELFDARMHGIYTIEEIEHSLLIPRQIARPQPQTQILDDGLDEDYEGGSIAIERLKGSLKRCLEERCQGADAEALSEAAGRAARFVARILQPNHLPHEDGSHAAAPDLNRPDSEPAFDRALGEGVDERIVKAAQDRYRAIING